MDTTQHLHEDSEQSDAPAPSGVISLLQGLVDDVKLLVGQQVRLALHELQVEGARAVTIVAAACMSGMLVALCLLFLMLTAVAALHELAGLTMWMSCGVVTLALMIAAGGCLLYLKQRARRLRIVPAWTLHTVKENAQWIKERIASPRT